MAEADLTRSFVFAPEIMDPMGMIEGPFTINGALMDMDVINETVPLGNTEIWTFQNNTQIAHPLHIHDIQFNILDRNGAPPDAWETGWKDVVYVPPIVLEVVTRVPVGLPDRSGVHTKVRVVAVAQAQPRLEGVPSTAEDT